MKWNNIEKVNYENLLEKIEKLSPYERLEVEYGVDMAEVKKSYRKKIKLYHPDRLDEFMLSHGEEITKLLNQAYESIKEDQK